MTPIVVFFPFKGIIKTNKGIVAQLVVSSLQWHIDTLSTSLYDLHKGR